MKPSPLPSPISPGLRASRPPHYATAWGILILGRYFTEAPTVYLWLRTGEDRLLDPVEVAAQGEVRTFGDFM